MARLNTLTHGKKVKGARRGFTMIELIFVVIFLGIMAAIAIPKIMGSTESATLASMKNDARANISAMQTYYVAVQEYPQSQLIDGGEKGRQVVAENKSTGVKVKLVASPHNKVSLHREDCDGEPGFSIEVTSDKTDKSVTYNSCTDASIQVVNGGSGS